MINSIKLENWKTHHCTELEFGKGTNVLVGEMGSGKSSVMSAISFALFGTFPELQSRRLSLDEVIMNRPFEADSAKVELVFDYGGKEFRVERKLKKGSKANEAKLFLDGRLIAGPKLSDVNERIEKELQVSYGLFSRAVYSEQNQIDFFLRLTPRERKEKFDELLDLEKYERVRSGTVTVANRLGARASDLKKFVAEQEKAFTEKDLEEQKKRLEGKKREERELAGQAEALEKSSKEAGERIAVLEKKEAEFRVLNDAKVAGEARLKEMRSAIEEASSKLRGKGIEELKKEAGEQEKELEKLKHEKEMVSRDLKEKQEKINKKVQEKGIKEAREKELEKHALNLEEIGAECPLCKRAMEKSSKEALLEENKQQREKLSKEISEVREQREKLGKAKKELEGKECKTAESEEEAKKKLSELKELLEKASRLEGDARKAKDLEEELGTVLKQLKELGFDGEKLSGEREELSKLKEALAKKAEQKTSFKQLLQEMEKTLEGTEKALKQVHESREQIKKIKETVSELELFKNALTATQAELRETLVEGVNLAMDSVWQKLYPYNDYTSARMEIEEGSYELKARTRQGNWVRVEGILSGGERSAAALCIRIAFSLVLTQNLSWLILDEPTHNLDENAVRVLSEMLCSHLPSIVEQIFIITHDKEMEKAASATLYEMQRDKDAGGATKPVLQPLED